MLLLAEKHRNGPSIKRWERLLLSYRTLERKATTSVGRAVAVVAHTFPQGIYQQLDGIDFRILNEIAFLSKQQKKRTGSAYCCPGRKYLAAKVGCDIGTISRHTSKLVSLGILEKRQRRPIRGVWQTCLYKLVSWAAWALAGIAGALRQLNTTAHRVRLHAHIASEKTEIITPAVNFPVKNDLVTNILRRWEARGT